MGLPRQAIIISASSDIGCALSERWAAAGWKLSGTFRTHSQALERLQADGVDLVHCDLHDPESIPTACSGLSAACPEWDALVLCPGLMEPVGAFAATPFEKWAASVAVNFTAQMRVVHELLPYGRVGVRPGPCVILFAGGGTNNAPISYSAYTVSKIALIKMCELLDAEIPDIRFVIVGPGWVKTKIHEATLRAGARAGSNYQRTIQKLQGDDCTPMQTVLDCLDWLVDAPREVIGGRNFSVEFDRWGTDELQTQLLGDPDLYKLRRHGNDRLFNDTAATAKWRE